MSKKTRSNKLSLLRILFFIFAAAFSVEAKDEVFRFEHTINSKFPVEKRSFTVQLPKSYYSHSQYKYPVIYLLDGQSNLEYSQTVAEFLSDAGSIPEVIIVGIQSGANRGRDYLPKNEKVKQAGGEANQFLNFIERELIPFIEGKYRAAPLRMLSGHSFGGLFVTYAMIEKPHLFSAYFAQSPFLDAVRGTPIVTRMEKFLEDYPKYYGFYYMNIGNEPNLEQNFARMKKLFETKAPKSFIWYAERKPLKTHMTTRLVGQYNALERFFVKDWVMSQKTIVSRKYAGVKTHIDDLSKKYGYKVLFSKAAFAQATQIFLQSRDVASATKMARLYSEQYPKSPIAHFFLAVAYRSSGKKQEAIKMVGIAINLFEINPDPSLKQLYTQMKRLQQVLAN